MTHITVMEWQRVLAFVDGRLHRVLEPGRHRYRARRTQTVTVDMRPRSLDVPGQEIITGDGVTVRASLTARWRVTDPLAFTTAAESSYRMLYIAVQDAIRARIGEITLDTAITDRSEMSEGLTAAVQAATSELGIEVAEVIVRDLMLPADLRRAAMDTVVARERGKAALEEARAEHAALRTLANVARLVEEHPGLLHLRTLQVAAERSTTLVLDPRDRPAAGTDAAAAG